MRFWIRVAGLLVHSGHVLLAKHRSHPFWLLPGGRLDPGESVLKCLEREFREESGLRVTAEMPFFIGDFVTKKKHVVDIGFTVRLRAAAAGLPRIRPGAGDGNLERIQWFPLDGLPRLGPPPLGALLKRIAFRPDGPVYGGRYGSVR